MDNFPMIEIGPNLLAAIIAVCSAVAGILGYRQFVKRKNGGKPE